MNYIRKIAAFILSFSMVCAIAAPSWSTIATTNKSNHSTSSKSSDQKIDWKNAKTVYLNISSDLKFEGTLSVSDEFESNCSLDKKEFYKKAKLSGMFLNSSKNESILTNALEVTFKYDKEKAYIENPKSDVLKTIYSSNESTWKVSSKEEVFCAPTQCIVSQQSNIYQKTSWYNLKRSWDYYDNFHIDLLCSPSGEIDFNIKSSPHLSNDSFSLTTVSTSHKELGNGIIRQEKIKDYLYNKNEKNDKYNYVTRKVELVYKNSLGNNIAVVKLESNFRYNKITKESECLSTIHREAVVCEDDCIDVHSRTGNETRSKGGSYTTINLEHLINDDACDFDSIVKTTCDFDGNLVTEMNTR